MRQSQGVPDPEAERHLGVGVVAAEHEDAGVEEDQTVGERGQWKAPVRRQKDRDRDQDRRDLEEPGVPVPRSDTGQEKKQKPEEQENQRLSAPIQGSLSSGGGSPRTSVRS